MSNSEKKYESTLDIFTSYRMPDMPEDAGGDAKDTHKRIEYLEQDETDKEPHRAHQLVVIPNDFTQVDPDYRMFFLAHLSDFVRRAPAYQIFPV